MNSDPKIIHIFVSTRISIVSRFNSKQLIWIPPKKFILVFAAYHKNIDQVYIPRSLHWMDLELVRSYSEFRWCYFTSWRALWVTKS